MTLSRLARLAYWVTPSLFCLVLYWYGFRSVYQMDDFAWLALPARVHDFQSFLAAMFQPLAQGTIRPWSERLFFFAGWHLFGLEATPLRVVVFVTQFANLVLLSAITRRLTGSSLAGLAAPILWLSNGTLYEPMAWTSTYNQVQCALFLLLALWFWILHIDTGAPKFLYWQWVVFVLGFGSLEINVVYPAIAALYALCFGRSYLPKTIPMFLVSAIYAAIHRFVAPPLANDIYRMYLDTSLFTTLWRYLRAVFGMDRYASAHVWPVWPHYLAEALTGGGLLIFILVMMKRRQWLGAFGAGWFLIVLSPVLPLRNHFSDYYLTVPTIGLAMAGAWGIAIAMRKSLAMRCLTMVLALLYLLPSVWLARTMTREYYETSRRAQRFVSSVAYADRLHSDKTIVVRNVDNEMFWAAWWDFPFQIFGRKKIFVSAESEPEIVPLKEAGTLSRFFLSQAETLEGLRQNSVVVYQLVEGGRLRNVTGLYRAMLEHDESLAMPKYIDLGQPLSAVYLTNGWWEPEGNFRWSSGHSVLKVRGPSSQSGELVITGRCPPVHMAKGPLHLTITVDGNRYPASTITNANLTFSFHYPLEARIAGKRVVEIVLDVDRTLQVPGDKRDLGLAMATVEVVR